MTVRTLRVGVGLALGAAAFLVACDSPTVPRRSIAYQFAYEGFGLQRLVYRWTDGHVIGVYVLPSGDTERDAVLESAFRHTANVWNDAVLFGQYRIERVPLERAEVILAWSNQNLPIDTSECPPFPAGLAWTTFCATADFSAIGAYPLLAGEHRDDGVHMIVQVLQSETDPARVAALVAHEFGHVLGIGTHPCRLTDSGCSQREGAQQSLMFDGIPDRSTPSAADRSTIDVLYQTRPHLTP